MGTNRALAEVLAEEGFPGTWMDANGNPTKIVAESYETALSPEAMKEGRMLYETGEELRSGLPDFDDDDGEKRNSGRVSRTSAPPPWATGGCPGRGRRW